MLDEATKDRIRVHLGVPVDGVSLNGFTTGYRFFEAAPVGLLEYRMINLKPHNEAEITGNPIGDMRLYGIPVPGDVLAITLGSTTPVIPTTPSNFSEINHSGTIAVQNIAQLLMPANPNRVFWEIQNLSEYELWYNDTGGTAAANGLGSYRIGPGASYATPAGEVSPDAITIVGTQVGQAFTCVESAQISVNAPQSGLVVTQGQSLAYVVGINDAQSKTPLYMIAQNLAIAFNSYFTNSGIFASCSAPIITIAVDATPVFAQVILQSVTPTPFTFSVAANGATSFVVTRQGVLPQTQFTNNLGNSYCGYVAILDYLLSQTLQSDSYMAFETADVVKFSQRELGKRTELYQHWQQRLADFFGVPTYPMGQNNRAGRGLAI
jgi:hypothetical protein